MIRALQGLIVQIGCDAPRHPTLTRAIPHKSSTQFPVIFLHLPCSAPNWVYVSLAPIIRSKVSLEIFDYLDYLSVILVVITNSKLDLVRV